MPGIPVQTCAKIVSEASKQCVASSPVPPPTNFDALSVSIGAQTNAIAAQASWLTFGSILLAFVAIVAGIAWGKYFASTAETEARKVAQACADAHIGKWLEEVAPPLIKREVTEFLRTLGNDGLISLADADAMAAAAGIDRKEDENEKK